MLNAAPRASPYLHAEVSAFAEMLHAGNSFGTQAWSPAQADEDPSTLSLSSTTTYERMDPRLFV
jgi:hypothetical protein